MPRTRAEIEALLDRLADETADALEAKDLAFRQWDGRSFDASVWKVAKAALEMVSGFRGGGTVVIGVADGRTGRDRAVVGVPSEVSVDDLRSTFRACTAPVLTPVFEEMAVPEGTGRLIVVHVRPTSFGYMGHSEGKTEDGRPSAEPLRRLVKTIDEPDFTAATVDAPLDGIVSSAAMESLREGAREDMGPDHLIELPDADLLAAIGVIRDGRPTRAAVLLAGSPEAVRAHVPRFHWTHVRASPSGDCSDRAGGSHAIPVALERILERIMADNPVETVDVGSSSGELLTYHESSLREAVRNALCHGDFRAAGPILAKQYDDRIEIGNPGGLVGGVTPANILRHRPASRNPCLVEAWSMLRMRGRPGLSMEFMFREPLIEGKPPPTIEEVDESVRLTLWGCPASGPFLLFIAESGAKVLALEVLVLQWVARHGEIDVPTGARLLQEREQHAYDSLDHMDRGFRLLRRVESENGEPRWTLRDEDRARLAEAKVARLHIRPDGVVLPASVAGRAAGEEQDNA